MTPLPNEALQLTSGLWKRRLRRRILFDPLAAERGRQIATASSSRLSRPGPTFRHADRLRVAGYRFFFFSNERQEPAPIHVERAEAYAKYWLSPVALACSHGFRSAELAELRRLVDEHRTLFQEKWDEFFGR